MKFNLDKRYTKFSKYLIFTAVIIYLLFRLIDSIPSFYDNFLAFISGIWDVSFPIILGFIIAYLLFGLMNSIENFLMKRKHFPHNPKLCRGIGVAVSYLLVLFVIVFLFVGIYFMIGGQLSKSSTFSTIVNYVSDYVSTNSLSPESVQQFINEKNIPFGDVIIEQLDTIADFLQSLILSLVTSVSDFVFTLGSNLFDMLISVILSIYVLLSYEYFQSIWKKLFYIIFRGSKPGKIVRRSLHIINDTFSKYIRGQLIEASIVAVLSTIVLTIVGADYAPIIGIIAGICNLVPYIGPFIGIMLAGVIALFSGNLFTVIASIIGLFIVQQIDCNILCPKIVGDIVGLHPAFILIAITIGGNWAGLIGMLIAVPVCASLKIIFSDWFDFYMKDKYEKYENSDEEFERGEVLSAFDLSDTGDDETADNNTSANNVSANKAPSDKLTNADKC